MQTFSIAAQTVGAFSFGVDPANTAIVTFSYPDPADATRTMTARFNRNGAWIETIEPPVAVKAEAVPEVKKPEPVVAQHDQIYDRKTGDGTSRDMTP